MQDESPSAEVRCVCGKVSLRFLQPMPVLHVHCCCADCRQGREWVASMGGPPVKRAVTLIYYFANDLAPPVPSQLPLLYVVKLRHTGRTTRLVTRCCHSVLAIDHPYYNQNVICVHPDVCDLVSKTIAPLSRIFSSGWDTDADGEMPPETAALEDSQEMWSRFAQVIKRPVQGAKGISLQELFAMLAPPMILGLADKTRS